MRKKKENCLSSFSTVELIVSISIIVILGGMMLLNYGLQKNRMDLNNATYAVVQSLRKAQGLALGQVAVPEGTTAPEGPNPCSNSGQTAQAFGVSFEKDQNKISLFAQDASETKCYFETRYFSPSIYISTLNPVSSNTASITFERSSLEAKINPTGTQLQITLCIKGQICSGSNIKTITVNNKGMIDH